MSMGINRILNDLVKIYPFYNYVMVVTPEGDVFAVNTNDNQGEKIASEELLGLSFQNTAFTHLPTNETIVGNPAQDPFLPQLGSAPKVSQWFVTPVTKGTKMIGWVVVSYNWQELSNLLGSLRKELASQGNPIIGDALVDDKGSIIVGSGLSKKELALVSDQIIKKKPLTFGNTTMNLVVASDKTRINAPIAMAVRSSMAITGVSAIILLAVLYLILQETFLSKLKALIEGTNAYQHGDLSYRLPPLGNDELGLLASTLNVMGESLQKAALELELKVEERTAELKIANKSLLKQIEERKKAEQALAKETSLLSGLLDSVPDIVFFKDKKGVYSGCNPEFSRFVGRDRAQIIGSTDYDLFEKELADSFCNNDRIMMEQAKARRNEEWIDYPDGRRRLIDTYKAPLRSANGDTIGVLGVSRDITERKRIEEDLLESEENFRTFFETMDDIIVVATPDGKMIYSNPAASRKLSYDPEELKAMHVLDLHPEAKRQEAERIFAECSEAKGTFVPCHWRRKMAPICRWRPVSGSGNGVERIAFSVFAKTSAKNRKLFKNSIGSLTLTLPLWL